MENENIIRMAGTLVDLLDGMGYSWEETFAVTALMRQHLKFKKQHDAAGASPVTQNELNLN